MSTLKANKVRNVSATVDNLELDSSGNVSVYGVGDVATALAAKAATSAIKVVQIVTAVQESNTSVFSTTFTDSGLSATITPYSSSNTILILVGQRVSSIMNASGSRAAGLRLLRGATVLRTYTEFVGHNAATGAGGYSAVGAAGFMAYQDSPATTSATTYKTQIQISDTASNSWVTANPSTIILMEVAP